LFRLFCFVYYQEKIKLFYGSWRKKTSKEKDKEEKTKENAKKEEINFLLIPEFCAVGLFWRGVVRILNIYLKIYFPVYTLNLGKTSYAQLN